MSLRRYLVLLVPFAFACGASTPPPESAVTTTPPPASASAVVDTPPPTDPTTQPTMSPAPTTPSAPAAPAHTPPTLAGTIAGKPFTAVAACIAGAGRGKGTVYMEIYDVKDFDARTGCGALPATPGARKIGAIVAWGDGAKTDLSTLKGGKEPQLFVMASTDNPKKFDRKDTQKDFKPKGTLEVVHAGSKKGDVARVKLDLTAGKDKLAGEVDVDLAIDVP